jgi:hypothetical protein
VCHQTQVANDHRVALSTQILPAHDVPQPHANIVAPVCKP